jgi:hypothetical protein
MRVRYGHRRIMILLKREGWAVNGKRIYRFYQELGLQLRNNATRRPSVGSRPSCGGTVSRRCAPTTCGRWTSCTTS